MSHFDLNIFERDVLVQSARFGPVLPGNISSVGAIDGLVHRDLLVSVWVNFRQHYAITDKGMQWLITHYPEVVVGFKYKEVV